MYKEKEVRAGMALLDRYQPGWYRQLEGAVIDVNDIHECPLGRLYGQYSVGLCRVGLDDAEWGVIAGYGFTLLDYEFQSLEPLAERLSSTWMALIKERNEHV